MTSSARAEAIRVRTYARPTVDGHLETWPQTVDRVMGHQQWLWERAKNAPLDPRELAELDELRALILRRAVFPSGRILWMGGTSTIRRRESASINCAGLKIQTVHDVVDTFWLLLQGCGVGFEPVPGILNGFAAPLEVVALPSEGRTGQHDYNIESVEDGVWTIRLGDSAEAWAKAAGKLVAGKPQRVRRLVLDFSAVRPAGSRLKGYGWLSSGDSTVRPAFLAIADILNRRHGQLLTRIDILDIVNHLGTTLSSRRSAQIALMHYHDDEADAFIHAKKDCWEDNPHRQMSNNSLLIDHTPSKAELYGLFAMMANAGGSEPGFFNAVAAKRRAPYFNGVNPCAESLLGNRSVCNLTEVVVTAFDSHEARARAVYLAARMNYRQTCINLDDGILQRSWHELNQFLRLCGVGLTGLAGWTGMCAPALRHLRTQAHFGANAMARELGLPRSKNVTLVKPSGTLGKVADCSEGIHTPHAQYLLNNVSFSRHDPLLERLKAARYRVFDHPTQADARLVAFPVEYSSEYFTEVDGSWVNMESAVDQLARYKLLMNNYVDHNVSCTVSYDPAEVPAMVDWLAEHWDSYVGTAFMPRVDPTKGANDLGYAYLPQEAITDRAYRDYVRTLQPLDLDGLLAESGPIPDAGECAGGACPVR